MKASKKAPKTHLEPAASPEAWQLINKVHSRTNGHLKSTHALEVPGAGCFLKVVTEGALSTSVESVCFAPGVSIRDDGHGGLKLVGAPGAPKFTITTGIARWVGETGQRVDAKLAEMDTIERLSAFIHKTWKITPTLKQVTEMRTYLCGHCGHKPVGS
jgi:hypothetical protein